MNLIIVESPTKARTLGRLVDKKFQIEATMGHIRDLPRKEFGVDIEKSYKPKYIIAPDKKKTVSELVKIAAKADKIILATDPDREGEAIAWHVAGVLESKLSKKKKLKLDGFQRIVFHEITKSAINHALKSPKKINTQLVDAQQARRVLDRIVGYKLSPLLWQKLSRRWLSAGRVQSVSVRLIVEREKEIKAFKSQEYWTIEGEFVSDKEAKGTDIIKAQLVSKNENRYEKKLVYNLFDGKYATSKTTISSQKDAQEIISDLKDPFVVRSVDKKEIRRSPGAPYTTSSLQQDAGRKLYFSSKRTMQVAQKLYEEGIITYHRTDSVNLSSEFVSSARDYIKSNYGNEYISSSPRNFKTKSKVAQEAHEAIRPTDLNIHSNNLVKKGNFNRDHIRLYDLIYKRSLATQAADAVFDSTTLKLISTNGYMFQTQGSIIKFDGYLKIYGREKEDKILPEVAEGEELKLLKTIPDKHFTNPPPRYSEASLVKAMEEKDIGRPSTYAPVISTIQDRNYVIKKDKRLEPTELGIVVSDFLVLYFPNIIDLPFTANLESGLDEIASGKRKWVPVIDDFYQNFQKSLDTAYKKADRIKMKEEKTDELCPECKSELVIRIGKYGKFIACSTYPKCKYTRQHVEKIGIPCPKCGSDMVVKKSKKGKTFYGCSAYPKCTFAAWKKEDIK